MRPQAEYDRALELFAEGRNDCEVARQLNVARGTIRYWRVGGRSGRLSMRERPGCPRCHGRELPARDYAYLLGLYLGDGSIATHPRGVYRLRISQDARYRDLISEAGRAMASVKGRGPIGEATRVGCVEINAYWKHWPCLFPQHGPGPKHERPIVLRAWQTESVRPHLKPFVRGLIHSDGCRVINRVAGQEYSRYQFSNRSSDIRMLFADACSHLGVRWRSTKWTIDVSRHPDVAFLDSFVGPKT